MKVENTVIEVIEQTYMDGCTNNVYRKNRRKYNLQSDGRMVVRGRKGSGEEGKCIVCQKEDIDERGYKKR